MITQELLDYIRQQLQAGTSRDAISQGLRSGGWSPEDVNEAFTRILTTQTGLPVPSAVPPSAPSRGKSTGLIIGLIAAVIVVVAILLAAFAHKPTQGSTATVDTSSSTETQPAPGVPASSTTPAPTASQPETQQASAAGTLFQTYSQPEGGFSFSYPSSWQLTHVAGRSSGNISIKSSAVVQIISGDSYAAVGIVPGASMPGTSEAEQWSNAQKNQALLSSNGGTEVKTTVGGFDAIGLSKTSGGVTTTVLNVDTPGEITTVNESYSANEKTTADAIVASIVFR